MSFARFSQSRRNVLVLLPLLAACGVDASPPNATVRDSAGVRIVEYQGVPEAARTLRLSEQPLYRHGGRPGDRLFARVPRGVLRRDGGAAIADVGTGPGAAQEVVELAPDGSLGAIIARAGQGPEEVRGVLSLHAFGGDSLLIEDDGNAKLMVFAGTEHVRNVSLQGRADLGRALRVLEIDDEGKLLMITSSYRSDFTVPWLPGSMVHLDAGTLLPDTVATFDMAPRQDREGPRNPFVAFGIAEGSGGRFIYMRSDIPEITWRGPDGALEQIVRWSPERIPVTEGFLANYKEALRVDLARVNPGMEGAELAEFLDRQTSRLEVPPGTVLPLTQTMSGDDVGRVWLPEYMPTPGFGFYPTWYEVIDADGTWLGKVQMPPRFRLLDVAGDRVLGVQLDELDVEHVVVYELIEG